MKVKIDADVKLDRMNLLDHKAQIAKTVDQFLADKSRRYSSHGYWTLEVFYKHHSLIPEDRVTCLAEPQLVQEQTTLFGLREETYLMPGRAHWSPVTVTYTIHDEESVGGMLIRDSDELLMVHDAHAELTYWLGSDAPERTWRLNNWMVTGFEAVAPKSSQPFGLELTFIFSEGILTRH